MLKEIPATYYGYSRYSSDEQSDGDSERRQIAGHEATAKHHGHTLVLLPTDRAVSAYAGNNLRNGSLAVFIEDARRLRIKRGSWLGFEDFDRFSRAEASVAAEVMFTLVNLGIVLCTTSDGRTCRKGSDVTEFIIPLIRMQGAHDDNNKRASRVRAGIADRRSKVSRETALTGRVPGWLTVVETKLNGKVIGRRAEEIPARGDVVRRMFELSATGRGDGAIAGKFNTDKVPTFEPRPNGWQKSYINKILTNRAVIGEFQAYETERVDDKRTRKKIGDPAPGVFPLTVPFDLWRRVEMAKARRGANRPGRPSREAVNLFSGLCKCGACGGGMELRAKGKGGGGDFLMCANNLRKVGCAASRNYQIEKLETAFFDNWSGLFARQTDFALDDDGNNGAADAAQRLDEAEQQILFARKRLTNLTDALSEAESTDERRPIRTKIAESQVALDRLIEARTAFVQALEIVQATENQASQVEMERVMQSALLSQDADARRRLAQIVREVVTRIVFSGDAISFAVARGRGQLVVTMPKGTNPTVAFTR